MRLYITNLFGCVAVVGALVLTPTASFAETSVFTNFNVSSNTGGNSATGGEIIGGESSARVDITTTINGETVVDIHEESSEGSITVETTTHANETGATTTTRVERGEEVIEDTVHTDVRAPHSTEDVRADEVIASSSTTTSTVINRHWEDRDPRGEVTETTSPLTRLVSLMSHTLSYVLSIFFS